MPNDKRFALNCEVVALGNRKGEVKVYSTICRYSYGDNDPSVTSNKFDKELKALEDVDEITVRINSPGGSVGEAIAIRTMLMKHKAKKVIDIEGNCCSAATLIACMPGAKVRMAHGGEYMIHCCAAYVFGNADSLSKVINSMVRTDRDMAGIYAERTGKEAEDCLALMRDETWYSAEEAIEAGFVDEIITGAEDEVPLVACAADEETMALMRACYAHAPEGWASGGQDDTENRPCDFGVSNEQTAVAEHSTEINNEGVTPMDLKNATAEQLGQENPELAAEIARQAVAAERQRTQEIDDMTPPGDSWRAMAEQAKADGTSAMDYHKQVVAQQKAQHKAWLEQRGKETEQVGQVGAGDAKDADDDLQAKQDKTAKELAALADSMDVTVTEM